MSYFLAFILFQITGFTIYKKAKLSPMSSFISGIFFATIVTYIFGIFNLLYIGRLLFFIAILIVLLYDFYKNHKNNYFYEIKSYFNIFNIMNSIACLLFLAIYIIQNPLFSYWDEYSFWGFSAKVAVEFNSLLSSFDYVYYYNEAIIAGSSVLTYVFNIFSTSFNDYSLLFSYTTVTLSTFALASEFIVSKINKENKFIAPILFLMLSLTPFLQTFGSPSADYQSIHYAYSTSLVDFFISILAFNSVLLYFSNRRKPIYIISLLVLTLIKSVGIFFAILCLCVIACFEIFIKSKSKKIFFKKISNILIAVFAIYFIYTSWPAYLSREVNDSFDSPVNLITQQTLEYQKNADFNEAQSEHNEENTPALKEGNIIQKVISSEYRTSEQNNVINSMFSQFLTSKNTFYIKDSIIFTALTFLGFASIFFINKQFKFPLFLANLGVSVGFVVYLLAISLFIANFNDGMVEYPRYSSSYYWLWIYFAITLISLLLINFKKISAIYLLTLLFAFNLYILKFEHTVISSPENRYSVPLETKNESERYTNIFNENPRILLISDRFFDYKLMLDTYYTIPALTNVDIFNSGFDFSMSFSNKEFLTDDNEPYFIIVSDEEFLNIAFQNFDYIYITHNQYEFIESFSEYFNSEIIPYSLFEVNEGSKIPFEVVE